MARRSPGRTICPSVAAGTEFRRRPRRRQPRRRRPGVTGSPMRARSIMPCTTGVARSTCSTRAAERQRVAPERHPHAERALQLEQVRVVHAGQEQRVGAFSRQLVGRSSAMRLRERRTVNGERLVLVSPLPSHVHVSDLKVQRFRSARLTGGRRALEQRPRCRGLGKRDHVAERRRRPPAASRCGRSPRANPPCGGAPARERRRAGSRTRRLISSGTMPSSSKILLLQRGVGDPDRAAAQLVAVVHRVVVQRAAAARARCPGTRSPRGAAT